MDTRLRGYDEVLHSFPSFSRGRESILLLTFMQPAVYIMASKPQGTLYIGVTSDLVKRIWQHRTNATEGFTKKYSVHTLVYFELLETMESAILREKQLKHWNRRWKIDLIEANNSSWRDLWDTISRHGPSPSRG